MDLTHEGPDPAGPGRRCRAALLAVAAGAVVLAGCSTPSTGPSGPTPAQARQQLARVLRAWAAFPASASPRPIVVTSPRVSDPASGFPDAATKLAYIAGAISPPAALPPGPATAAGYPLISAGAAVDVLTSVAVQGPAPSVRLAVIAMSLGTGVFDTDRGPIRLPAAVAVALITHVHGDPNAACSSVAYSRHATTILPVRLGSRALVDAPSATAIIVTRADR
jgi:hypothetical protein